MAEGRRTIYASVRIPGHTLAEVASYIYGSADQAEALSSGNGGLPEHLPAGRTLRLTGGTLSEQAVGDINRGIEQGTIMRSEGIPTESAERTTVYRFSADGRSFEVTETQYVGMMQGSVVWLQRKARFLRDSANDGRWCTTATSRAPTASCAASPTGWATPNARRCPCGTPPRRRPDDRRRPGWLPRDDHPGARCAASSTP
jgi:hypothetical protein